MKKCILDKDHNLVEATLMEWATWIEDFSNKRVAEDYIDDLWISTVFLGIDHGFGGKPLWFETMVFLEGDETYCERYATWDEAQAGHKRIVKQERNKVVSI